MYSICNEHMSPCVTLLSRWIYGRRDSTDQRRKNIITLHWKLSFSEIYIIQESAFDFFEKIFVLNCIFFRRVFQSCIEEKIWDNTNCELRQLTSVIIGLMLSKWRGKWRVLTKLSLIFVKFLFNSELQLKTNFKTWSLWN